MTTEELRRCNECKADKQVRNIKSISDDKQETTLEWGHTFEITIKNTALVVDEKVGISEDAFWVISKNPVDEIRKAIEAKDYFKTVTYTCTISEYSGLQILIWDSKRKTGNNSLPTTDNKEEEGGRVAIIIWHN